jgi:hypothetical protein
VGEGSFRKSACFDFQYGHHLEIGFRRLSDERLGWLVRFYSGLLEMTGGRFLSMTSVAAHSRWPLRQPSLRFGFRRLSDEPLGRLVQFCVAFLGVTEERFLSMTSASAHSRWPPRQPSWVWFPSIIWRTPQSGLSNRINFACVGVRVCVVGVSRGRFLS